MDRWYRPFCAGALAVMLLLCTATAPVWGEEASPSQTLADLLQQAEKATTVFPDASQAKQKAATAATTPPKADASEAKPKKSRHGRKAPEKKTPEGFSDIRLTMDGSFDLHVQDADIRTVLRQLSVQAKKNIVSSSQVTGTVTADLYGVTFSEALRAVIEATGLVHRKRESVIYVFTQAEKTARQEERELETRVFHLAYLRAITAHDLIKDMLSPKGKAMVTPAEHTSLDLLPSPTWSEQRRANVAEDVLVVYDYEDILEKVAKTIESVDIKPKQVLIEATILSAQLNDDNALGVDLQGLIGTNFNSFGMTSDLTDMNVGFGGGVNDFSHWQSRVNTNFSQNMLDQNTYGPPFTFGIVYDNVGAFVQALESVRDVTVLANPKLLVVNKQRGEILVGRRDGYMTTVMTDTAAIQQVEFLETGTSLAVRPFIGKNDNIRLEIHPRDSAGSVSLVQGAASNSPALPQTTTTEVTTNIIVRDGKTVVIGGLFRDDVQTTRRQVPILGDIPWLGTAFRSTVDQTVRRELIIMITPHLVRDNLQEAIGERMRNVTERYRIGARKGLRWWGRNRLSATYLQRANQSRSEGDMDKARWWLDLCLSLQPDLVEAMLLKEQMTDEASWAHPPQFTDTRYLVTRMLMQEMGKNVDTILPPSRPLHDRQLRPEVRKALGVELKPKASGVLRRRERFVPVRRKHQAVPGEIDMKPAPTTPPTQAKKTPAPPVKRSAKPKRPVKAKTPPTPVKAPEKAPKKATKKPPAPPKPTPRQEKPTPAKPAPKKVSEPEPRPLENQPAPAPKPEPKPAPAKAPAKQEPKPAPTPEPKPAPAKAPEESREPRLGPIEDEPVSPTPELSMSPEAAKAKPSSPPAKPAPAPTKVSRDLPSVKANDAPAPGKTKNKPASTTPALRSNDVRPFEKDGKSLARRHLETDTLSALLEDTSSK